MPKYEVEIKETEIYHVPVECASQEEAIDAAHERMENEGKGRFHNDSDGDYTVYDEGELI